VTDHAPTYSLDQEDGPARLMPQGDWIITHLGDLPQRLARDLRDIEGAVQLDTAELGRIDTSGAYAIFCAVGPDRALELEGGSRDDVSRLAELLHPVLLNSRDPSIRPSSVREAFERVGRAVCQLGPSLYREQAFVGRLVLSLGRMVVNPGRLRLKPLVATMEQAGLAAIPIVVMMTFFIGAVLALVGSTMLQSLGVSVYAVELVGIGILREFGPVVAAILFAGRSASAFAAQLGSMRMNQEVDAMRVMGLDVFDALVVPRVLAALVMLPLLTLMADIGGLAGGMLVSQTMLGIEPTFFLQRLVDSVGTRHFWVGMGKTPLLALMIATVGCHAGLSVVGDVEQLGASVTAAVVRSIFLIIMFDAVFAVLYKQAGL